ncbi:ribosomal protein L18ae/LX family protein [Actinidia rufa]|uniref:Ribosomal protein L18ae/LX family protein n=1 Tax=Actinidia rufa TaxID=165716 RepID=A0A7J0DV22_9ERIC|nr:ribosomal protein L18ae/LX family protein [Actinidia rufa]
MSEEGGKSRGISAGVGGDPPPQYYYGTFQGVANYHPPPPPHPVVGFPQPAPPPGSATNPPYYSLGYQTVPGLPASSSLVSLGVVGSSLEDELSTCGHHQTQIVFLPQVMLLLKGDPLENLLFLAVVLELAGACVCPQGSQHYNRFPRQPIRVAQRFLVGFFLGAIPWYIGAFILLCVRVDYREKPGLIACMIAFHQYQVVGRALPSETDEHPKIYRMKLWATNEVRAKSKFWYFLRKLKKVKKSNGQMLAINEIFEKSPTKIKNYGIWLRYQSRTGYHNMYKEYRDTTLNGAVEQMYTEMASRHRVRHHCIQIIKTATIPAKLCKRESTKQFHNSKIKFPLVHRTVRPPTRKLKTTYKASRPNLFM